MFDAPFECLTLHPETGFLPMTLPALSIASDAEVEAQPDDFEMGYAAGQLEAEARFATERLKFGRLIASIEALQPEPSEELGLLIAETVASLTAQIVGPAAVDPEGLLVRATEAANLVSECDAARVMRLHPDDIALLADASLPLSVEPDAGLDRGSVRIDCSAGWIETGTSHFLQMLRVQLGLGEVSS
jgi:flagellar assembly protein FliH